VKGAFLYGVGIDYVLAVTSRCLLNTGASCTRTRTSVFGG
jgi:hypothetical protein